MWLLPILVVGALVIAAAGRSKEPLPPARQLAAPPPQVFPPGVPGPISVLGEILRIGQVPPPTVILCAIAEAEAIGRRDLASDIVHAFVVPPGHQPRRAKRVGPAPYERGSCALLRAPTRATMERPARHPYYPHHEVHTSAPHNMPPAAYAPLHDMPPPASHVMPPVIYPPSSSPNYPPPSPPPPAAPNTPAPGGYPPPPPPVLVELPTTDDGIAAMLDGDPAGFMDLATSGRPRYVTPPEPVPVPEHSPGSPIDGVSDDAWRGFVARLSRESPQFTSSRHVGQYRQRRERLAELGVDSESLVGSPQAQRAAIDLDLTDAHHHAVEGGIISEHLGRRILVPGREEAEMITLSGVLGVIQCAGLDGAVGWLERPSDRRRYPHTTQVFLLTNGAF